MRKPSADFPQKPSKGKCLNTGEIIETFIPICKDNKKQNKEKFQ